ncbi:divergent polysaccharide deacetylase family protein [Paenibacillus gansuensis]|uniref:Divergent polysaccharide deacetylase family protein n=1 Tax=Paenibacillus gansuensis TaxID=306542 RepID=A0ABW5P9N4_9BACL
MKLVKRWKLLLVSLCAITISCYMLPTLSAASAVPAEMYTQAEKRIAVVIDDFGNNMKGTEEMLKLPIPLTVAVMPLLPSSRRDAETAHRLGKEVIVHLPMEPVRGKKSWLGPGAITTDLTNEEIRSRVLAAIDSVPFAVGMNNHMGSKATADPRVMKVVLEVCKDKGLFFLDSRTSFKSVIPQVAEQVGVPVVRNAVFLDDVYSAAHVSKQISKLKMYLDSHQTCVTIGHVGPPGKITSALLAQSIPTFKTTRFVTVSELLPKPLPQIP